MKIKYKMELDNIAMSIRHMEEHYNNEILLDIESFINSPITTYLTKEGDIEDINEVYVVLSDVIGIVTNVIKGERYVDLDIIIWNKFDDIWNKSNKQLTLGLNCFKDSLKVSELHLGN